MKVICKSGADITVVCSNDSFHTENGTYFELDGQGRVTEVLFNLHTPRGYRGAGGPYPLHPAFRDLVDDCDSKDQYHWRRDVLQAERTSSI